MVRLTLTLFCLAFAETALADSQFYEHWADGKAELNSYRVVQPRYGELREGYGVLIFVTEDMNRGSLIKVETAATPPEDRVYVLKLNNVLKFNTGIYDYSVMTSVFSAVAGLQQKEPMELCKITLTGQEWCGHVFEEVLAKPGQFAGRLFSYFEAEGTQSYALPRLEQVVSEDHLLIRIRELVGPVMSAGEERKVDLLPALWQFRIRHEKRALAKALLRKGHAEVIAHADTSLMAIPWSWTLDSGRQTTAWVEEAYPHRIIRWKDSDGGTGELLQSTREPYWRLNSNADEIFRQRLEIP